LSLQFILTSAADSKNRFSAGCCHYVKPYCLYHLQYRSVPRSSYYNSLSFSSQSFVPFLSILFPTYILPYTTSQYTRHTQRAPYVQSSNKSSLSSCPLVKRFSNKQKTTNEICKMKSITLVEEHSFAKNQIRS